jgi:radical SAM enzyme (TIGR01210 family)
MPSDRDDLTAWILRWRPQRAMVDPFKPHGFFLEEECSDSGRIEKSGIILLTNKECPWRCLMCDLWKNTATQSVPAGAIPSQIDFVLRTWGELGSMPQRIKLYNSGSFFDSAAIPPGDYAAIAQKVAFARHIIVESHPRLIGPRALRLRDLLDGSLEVAMGLETAHPIVLERLNKKFTLSHFVHAAGFLRNEAIAVRAFVLVKPPFMNEAEGLEWAVKSADFAFSSGVNVVSLIPTRGGNGAMEQLSKSGDFSPPRLSTLEQAQQSALALKRGRVFADTWDLEPFSSCATCLEPRRQRLHAVNLSQRELPRIQCPDCDGL